MEDNRNGINNTDKVEQTPLVQVNITNNVAAEEKPKKRPVAVLVLQIITAIIYTLLTGFFISMLIDVAGTPPAQDGSFDGKGLALAVFLIMLIVFGGIGYIINLILSIVGIVVSSNAKKKELCGMGRVIYFVVFTLLPLITFIAFLIVPQLLN